jgi:hypothetical protein
LTSTSPGCSIANAIAPSGGSVRLKRLHPHFQIRTADGFGKLGLHGAGAYHRDANAAAGLLS